MRVYEFHRHEVCNARYTHCTNADGIDTGVRPAGRMKRPTGRPSNFRVNQLQSSPTTDDRVPRARVAANGNGYFRAVPPVLHVRPRCRTPRLRFPAGKRSRRRVFSATADRKSHGLLGVVAQGNWPTAGTYLRGNDGRRFITRPVRSHRGRARLSPAGSSVGRLVTTRRRSAAAVYDNTRTRQTMIIVRRASFLTDDQLLRSSGAGRLRYLTITMAIARAYGFRREFVDPRTRRRGELPGEGKRLRRPAVAAWERPRDVTRYIHTGMERKFLVTLLRALL